MKIFSLKLTVAIGFCFWTLNTIAQTTPAGNSYSTIISETCKERTNGGCWIVESLILMFEEDSVSIYSQIRGNCSPEDNSFEKDYINLEKFAWIKSGQSIVIGDNFKYGGLLIQGSELTGTHENQTVQFALIR